MVQVIIAGREYQIGRRIADMIIWLVKNECKLDLGAKWIEFTCRGETVLVRHGEEERIEHHKIN